MTGKTFPNSQQTIDVDGVQFTYNDIFSVVDDFYTRIQHDPVLKVPFQSVVDWPEHIERLTHFWWIRFGGKPYLFAHYNPAQKHFFAGFNRELLVRWLSIFHATLRTHLRPEQVAFWEKLSQRMGEGLSLRNEQIKEHFRKQNL